MSWTAKIMLAAKQIYLKGAALGNRNGCAVCLGGDPSEKKHAKQAHTGTPEGRP